MSTPQVVGSEVHRDVANPVALRPGNLAWGDRIALMKIRRSAGIVHRAKNWVRHFVARSDLAQILLFIASMLYAAVFLAALLDGYLAIIAELCIPIALAVFTAIPSRRLWSGQLASRLDWLVANHHVFVPPEILRLIAAIRTVEQPELVVMRTLPVSDTVSMIKLARTLNALKPAKNQPVNFEISGDTSETLSRVAETMQAQRDGLLVRL